MKKNIYLILVFSLILMLKIPNVSCEVLSKEFELAKEYTSCTFTLEAKEGTFENATAFLTDPSGNKIDFEYINGYFVCAASNTEVGTWKYVIESEETVSATLSVSTSSVNGNSQVKETEIIKKIQDATVYVEDGTIKASWQKTDDEKIKIVISNTESGEVVYNTTVADNEISYDIITGTKFIVSIVPVKYSNNENAKASFAVDTALLPEAEIYFEDEFRTNKAEISANVVTADTYTYIVNGSEVPSISLKEGSNDVTVKVRNDKGYIRNYSFNFVLDTEKPIISLDSDMSNMSVTTSSVTVSGATSGAVKLYVNNEEVYISSNGTFTTIVDLADGENNFSVIAVDDVGNATEYKASVTKVIAKANNKTMAYIIIAIVLSAGLAVFIAYILHKQKKEYDKALDEKEEELRQKNSEIIKVKESAVTDAGTGCKNKAGYLRDINSYSLDDICIINFDVNNLKWTNDTLGHEKGDKLLLTISKKLMEKFGTVYRVGGDEFIVLCRPSEFEKSKLYDLEEELNEITKTDPEHIIYQVAFGYAFGDGKQTYEEIAKVADMHMYERKKEQKKNNYAYQKEIEESVDSFINRKKEETRLRALKERSLLNSRSEIHEDLKESIVPIVKKKFSLASYLILEIVRTLLFIGMVLIGVVFVFYFGMVKSSSMSPTCEVGDVLIGNRLFYLTNEISRGDIVVVDKEEDICKRVIGLPGDTISFKDGYVCINGERCIEEYLDEEVETNGIGEYKVPEDSIFLLGDNRDNSKDSRFWEEPFIRNKDIKARILFTIPNEYSLIIIYALIGIAFVAILLTLTSLVQKRKGNEEDVE